MAPRRIAWVSVAPGGEDRCSGRVTFALKALLGYSREEVARMRVGDLPAIGPDWTESERADFVREGTWRGNMHIRRKDGVLIPVDVRATAVATPNETLYVVALRDLSAHRALERLERGLTTLLAREARSLSPLLREVVRRLRPRSALPRPGRPFGPPRSPEHPAPE